MNEWPAIPFSFIISFETFNGSMGLFTFFFSKDFQCIGWICYSRLTWFLMASNVSGLQEHDTVHGEQPSDASGTKTESHDLMRL